MQEPVRRFRQYARDTELARSRHDARAWPQTRCRARSARDRPSRGSRRRFGNFDESRRALAARRVGDGHEVSRCSFESSARGNCPSSSPHCSTNRPLPGHCR